MLTVINGCEIFLERMGPRKGISILAFHSPGGSVDSRYVKSIFKPFTDKYQIVIFDLRGCGRSQEVGSPSFSQLSEDAEAIRRYFDLGKVVVAGSSGAGYLALEYALGFPESVRGLLLWSTAPAHTWMRTLKTHARRSEVKLHWDLFQRYWSGNCRSNEDLKMGIKEFNELDGVLSPRRPAGRNQGKPYLHYKTHNYAMQEQSNGWSVESRLKEITIPTLVMHGDKDWIIPQDAGRKLAAGIPRSEFHVFKGASHWLHDEDPQKFRLTIARFLAKLETNNATHCA